MSSNKTELEVLKDRAKQMGIEFHPNIGLDKLKAKVNGALAPEPVEEPTSPQKETKTQRTVRLRKQAHKLVRIRVACMHPDKKEYEGEIITASNSAVGSIKKYVPFNNDEGWHVPQIILNVMKERKCQVFTWVKDSRGNKVKRGKEINEFAIEILPDLTPAELQELKERQALANNLD